MTSRRLLLVLALACGGCARATPETEPIVVFAAASTVDTVTEIARRYESATGRPVVCNFAASSTLARQIMAGADAEVFLSADTQWMDELEQGGFLADGTRGDLLGNALVWIAPRGRVFPLDMRPGADAAAAVPGRVSVANPDHVPAGRYAKAALLDLGWWPAIEPRLVPAVNVRAALRMVELEAVGSGIVYATDAAACDRVETIARFDATRDIRYPVAATTGAGQAAMQFLDFLRGPDAAGIFAAAGFTRPGRFVMTLATALAPTADEWTAVLLSLQVALAAVSLILVPGIAVAWLLARRRFPGRALLDAIVHLPLVLPPVVVGYVLLVTMRGIAFSWTAAAVASAVMGFPLLVRPLRLAIELADVRLEQAAATLGAGPWRRFLTITLPLALPGLLTGMVLSFARSLGEFGATITFAANIPGETRTLPLAIFTYAQSPGGDGPALRLVALAVILSLGALLASELLARRVRRRLEA